MNRWYKLAAGLETAGLPMEDDALRRVRSMVEKRLPKRRPRLRIVLVAAVILLLTACGVAAVRFADWFGSLANNTLEPEASEAVLASMGTAIDQSQTVDGLTVTLHGALWDGRVLLLSLSAEGDAVPKTHFGPINAEGSWLSWSKVQMEQFLREQGKVSERELETYLSDYEAVMADTDRVRLEMVYQAGKKETMLIATGEMASPASETELTLYLAELWGAGPFRFDFCVNQNRSKMVYTGEVDVALGQGVEGTVTRVLLTPLRAEVTLHGDKTFGLPQKLEIEGLQTEQNVFTSRKGRTVEENDDGTWDAVVTYGPLERVMDPAQVTGIYLGEYLLELNQMTVEE